MPAELTSPQTSRRRRNPAKAESTGHPIAVSAHRMPDPISVRHGSVAVHLLRAKGVGGLGLPIYIANPRSGRYTQTYVYTSWGDVKMWTYYGRPGVTTCEQCGANAVNARGVCEECGWRTAASGAAFDDSSPSLGETRAADVPFTAAEQRLSGAPGARAPITPMPPLERTTGRPDQPAAPRSAVDAQPRYSTAAPASTSRYCGTCGARIAPGEAFCGQCGTPVGAGSSVGATSLHPASGQYGRYQIESDSTWASTAGDAPTEAFVSSAQQYGRGFSSAPNGRGGYASLPGATPADTSARTGRIIVGVVCLIGSLASAIGAIVLAQAK